MSRAVDVARLAGVSRKTVSRVLNNEPYVSEEVRRRVLAAADQLGYRLNNAARWLSDVRAPAHLSSDPAHAKYTGNWASPYFSVLPQNVGSLTAGTLPLSTVVTGEDVYCTGQKAADPDWGPANGSAGAIGQRIARANTHRQVDPVWEPYLRVYDNQLAAST